MFRLLGFVIAGRPTAIAGLAVFLSVCGASGQVIAGTLYESIGARVPAPPSGWIQFCETYREVCDTKPLPPLDVPLDGKAWVELKRINLWVNHNIEPETDMDHYGMIQWWRYPDDGAGACHSYALLKRRMLIQAGWPRQALLMTIVHLTDGEGHAVLTVKTDHGDYILDNLTDKIELWSQTPYLYYMRQSQSDPNRWVWIAEATAAAAIPALDQRQSDEATEVGNVVREDHGTMPIVPVSQLVIAPAIDPSPAPAARTGWGVQLIGSASEASALASYQRMRQTYGSLLGSQRPLVLLSHVGVGAYWYRVRVAMNNRGDAENLCVGLRAAGGSCLVQRN